MRLEGGAVPLVLSEACAHSPQCFTAFPGPTPQDRPRGGLEEPQPGAPGHGERPGGLAQTVVNAQDSAVDQRSPVPGRGEPALGQ